MRYGLGLDMGVTSIGWAIIKQDTTNKPLEIKAMGVRKFDGGRDDKTTEPLAQNRRSKRAMRRQRERRLRRQDTLLNLLSRHDLMPVTNKERKLVAAGKHLDMRASCPYLLRDMAVREELSSYELGRVLVALNRRRGFKSNRKKDLADAGGKLKEGIELLEQRIQEGPFPTLGAYLAEQVRQNRPVTDKRGESDKVAVGREGLQTTRAMYEHEFDVIRQTQEPFFQLGDETWQKIRGAIFHQRPLKPVDRGLCQLYGIRKDMSESVRKRAYMADPLAQKQRIWQDINNLKIMIPEQRETRFLSDEERGKIWTVLAAQKSLTFGKLRTLLNLPAGVVFNLEEAKSGKLKGMETDCLMQQAEHFGPLWNELSQEEKTSVIEKIQSNLPEEEIVAWLCDTHDLTEAQAENIANMRLEAGTARFCPTALVDITARLAGQCVDKTLNRYMSVTEALADIQERPALPAITQDTRLPYYAAAMPDVGMHQRFRTTPEERQYGVIGNPTVHIGLNQLRQVVNALIETYGHPTTIAVEVARDLKMNKKQKAAHEREIRKNEALREELRQLCADAGLTKVNPTNRRDFMKYKLWRELDSDPNNRKCVYTGETISLHKLFSPAVEIEHILPRSWSLDDSLANLTVSMRDKNKMKGNLPPYEYFAEHEPEHLAAMLARALRLPPNKRWRFTEEARTRFADGEAGWANNMLNDTRHLSKVAGRYLSGICRDVRVSPGKLTAKARHQWFGNVWTKDRDADHCHHAIDALIVALLDRQAVQDAQLAAKQDNLLKDGTESSAYKKLNIKCPIDENTLQQQMLAQLNALVVSHRVDHGTQGALHKETALSHSEKAVQDPETSQRLFSVHHTQAAEIHHTNYYEPSGIHHADFWLIPEKDKKGKIRERIHTDAVYMHEAARPGGLDKHKPHPAAKFLMRLHKGDTIVVERDGQDIVGVVRKISPSKTNQNFAFLPVNDVEGKYTVIQFTSLRKYNVRKACVDVLGNLVYGNKKGIAYHAGSRN